MSFWDDLQEKLTTKGGDYIEAQVDKVLAQNQTPLPATAVAPQPISSALKDPSMMVLLFGAGAAILATILIVKKVKA